MGAAFHFQVLQRGLNSSRKDCKQGKRGWRAAGAWGGSLSLGGGRLEGCPPSPLAAEPVLAAQERAVRYPFLAPWHIPASLQALPELHRVLPLPSTTGTAPASP